MTGSLSGPLARLKADEKNCFGMTEWQGSARGGVAVSPEAHSSSVETSERVFCRTRRTPSNAEGSRSSARRRRRPLECSVALGMVAAETRRRIATRQAAGSLPWISVDDPSEEQRLQADTQIECKIQPTSRLAAQKSLPEPTTRSTRCRKTEAWQTCGTSFSARNPFERFRGFCEFFCRFQFDFRRCDFFLNDSNFWCVQSSITHNVAVHVHVLWLVCTHTFPFRMLWCP